MYLRLQKSKYFNKRKDWFIWRKNRRKISMHKFLMICWKAHLEVKKYPNSRHGKKSVTPTADLSEGTQA